MTPNDFEITIGEVSAMEARVQVRFHPAKENQERIILRGTLRGPYCETARTLPAEFPFRETKTTDAPTAEAVVPDPCLWSPDMPHMYHASVEALSGDRIIAEYHGQIGLRSTSPIRVHE
jgi:beta-galactosidase/beta-glucuronidase